MLSIVVPLKTVEMLSYSCFITSIAMKTLVYFPGAVNTKKSKSTKTASRSQSNSNRQTSQHNRPNKQQSNLSTNQRNSHSSGQRRASLVELEQMHNSDQVDLNNNSVMIAKVSKERQNRPDLRPGTSYRARHRSAARDNNDHGDETSVQTRKIGR